MKLSFLNKQQDSKEVTLLVDIGSASVGAALVSMGGDAPFVLASVREEISFQEVLSSQQFLYSMKQALSAALKKLEEGNRGVVVRDTFCTLSSPWFVLKTRKLNISRAEEFEVSEETLDGFIQEDVERLKEELKDVLPPHDVRVIEKKIIQMKLNGYEIKNPYKQRTNRMEMMVTVGISSLRVVQGIEHVMKKFFHTKEIHLGVFPVAAFSAVRDIFPTEKNFFFVDIAGEATDVSRVANDLLLGTIAFPYGKNFFIREISARLRTVHTEAASLFNMFLRGELDQERQAKIAPVIEMIETKWLARFEKTIATLSNKEAVPAKVFFTSDQEMAPIIEKLIVRAKSELLSSQAFDVQYLDHHIVSTFVSFNAALARDPFLVVEALLAKKVLQQISK